MTLTNAFSLLSVQEKKEKNQNKTLRAQREKRHINYYYHYWQVCQSSAYKARQEVFPSRIWDSITCAFQPLRPTVKEEGQASLGNRGAPGSYRSFTSAKFIFVTVGLPPHTYSPPQSPCPGMGTPCGPCCPVLCSGHELPPWHHRAAFRGKSEQQ